ncbi:PepSY domain-containing protein [Actinomadura sp. BRA 177]|nr:PepSY domain-containing protein [Actinomadura sp. BRA 177]
MLTGRGLLVTVVAAGVLAGGGATAAVAAGHDDEPAASATPTAGDRPTESAPQTSVSIKQAVDAALKAVPGKVAEIELDDEHGRTAWEVDVVAENGDRRDVAVDSGTGKVLTNRADDRDDDDRDDDPAALRKAKVTAPAAADAALKAVSGRVTSADFETEHGKAVWEVDVTGKDGVEHEVTVDAATGKVLNQEVDED